MADTQIDRDRESARAIKKFAIFTYNARALLVIRSQSVSIGSTSAEKKCCYKKGVSPVVVS